MDKSLQTSRRIDVESVEAITPAVRSSKETSPAAPRNKVSEKQVIRGDTYMFQSNIKDSFNINKIMNNNEVDEFYVKLNCRT